MKYKTVDGPLGPIDPKIVGQLVASAIAWVILRYAGFDLPPEAEAGIAAVVGVLVGALFPAPKTVPVASADTGTTYRREAGYGLVELVVVLLVVLILVFVLLRVAG